MKNTYVSLDMLFVGDDAASATSSRMRNRCRSTPSIRAQAIAVLELAAGTASGSACGRAIGYIAPRLGYDCRLEKRTPADRRDIHRREARAMRTWPRNPLWSRSHARRRFSRQAARGGRGRFGKWYLNPMIQGVWVDDDRTRMTNWGGQIGIGKR